MGITIGSTDVKKIYIGSTQVKEVYVGTNKVRPDGREPGVNTIAYYPLTADLLDHKPNGTAINLSVSGSGYSFTTTGGGKKGCNLTGSTYFYPSAGGNAWGKHIGTDNCTIAYRVCGYSSPAYGTLDYSGYHTGLISFNTNFKTGISSDGVLGKDVGILDVGYEGFSYSNINRDRSGSITKINGFELYTVPQTYLSIVDTFSGGTHNRYVSVQTQTTPLITGTYEGGRSVSYDYIGRDSYDSSNYRYMRGFIRDFVVDADVRDWTIIKAYFDVELD